ncbi:uncharacterized protein FMAN_15339 [Fusarium mangiferae]|uniref:Uncharacterized protein n=1 Tax=Fusarium mangiferae TaxID=192010 RepID=A0A1L7UJ78_FUSMA|nr:uncharacterized protein FMAN_15339 [Fusarium mangiferae]CVL07226.1 uncharacterized protein FMAN_15339 [Fusarium mangiferae]
MRIKSSPRQCKRLRPPSSGLPLLATRRGVHSEATFRLRCERLQGQEKEFQAWRCSGAGGTDGSWNTWVALKRGESRNSAASGYTEAGSGTHGNEQVNKEK